MKEKINEKERTYKRNFTENREEKIILEVKNLRKTYGSGDAKVNALNGIDLVVRRGEPDGTPVLFLVA